MCRLQSGDYVMKKITVSCNNRILAVFLTIALLCYAGLSLLFAGIQSLGNEVLYISTTSFTDTNTASSGSAKEYQMSGTAKLTQEEMVELVPNTAGAEGTLASGKRITITDGFSTAFKLHMGEGDRFLAGSIHVLLTGTGDYAGNNIGFDIYKSDDDIGTSVRKITGSQEESQEISLADFTETGTVETDLYCWLDYSVETDNLQVFLSDTSERPETPQAVYKGLGVTAHIGNSCYIEFTAKNPDDASQQVSICSFFLNNKYSSEGIDISVFEETESVDTYRNSYSIHEVTYTLTIHYVYEKGGTAAKDYTGIYTEGQAYSVSSPDISGYAPDTSTVKGIIGTADVELTVTYSKILKYSDLPGTPTADITSQSNPEDIWAKVESTDTVATEDTYENTSRPVMITASRWDDSSMAGVEVSAFQLLYMGTDGYVVNEAYQSFFDEKTGVTGVTALDVQKWLLSMNNQGTIAFIEDALQYIQDKSIPAISGTLGTVGSTSVTLDCSRRYEQSKGYFGGYGYYILYSEDDAGMEYALSEFTSQNPEISIYLKGNSLSLVKQVGKQDYSMNEDIVFTISSTIPNLEDAVRIEDYRYFITDTFSEGITPQMDTLTVQVVDADKTTLTLSKSDDYFVTLNNNTVTVNCDFATGTHLKNNQQKGKTLRINYKASLNENAVIASTGNENKASLTYIANPAETVYESKTTEESRVVVFTYQLEMRKVGSDSLNLGNVPFGVYDQSGNILYFVKGTDGVYRPAKESSEGALSQITTADDGTLYIEGVGTGEYTFREMEAPAGYLIIPEFTLTVSPAYLDSSVTALTAEVDDRSYIRSIDCYLSNGKILFVVLDPVQAGQLPRTGGTGRILCYLAGGILAGAGIVARGVRHRKEKL